MPCMDDELDRILAENARLTHDNQRLRPLEAQVKALRQRLHDAERALTEARRGQEAAEAQYAEGLAKWQKWKKWWKKESARFEPGVLRSLTQPPSPAKRSVQPEPSVRRGDQPPQGLKQSVRPTKRQRLTAQRYEPEENVDSNGGFEQPVASTSKVSLEPQPVNSSSSNTSSRSLPTKSLPLRAAATVLVEDTQYTGHFGQQVPHSQPGVASRPSGDRGAPLSAQQDVQVISIPRKSGLEPKPVQPQQPSVPQRTASMDSEATEDTPPLAVPNLKAVAQAEQHHNPFIAGLVKSEEPSVNVAGGAPFQSKKQAPQRKPSAAATTTTAGLPLSPSRSQSQSSSRTRSSTNSPAAAATAALPRHADSSSHHGRRQSNKTSFPKAKHLLSPGTPGLRSPPKKRPSSSSTAAEEKRHVVSPQFGDLQKTVKKAKKTPVKDRDVQASPFRAGASTSGAAKREPHSQQLSVPRVNPFRDEVNKSQKRKRSSDSLAAEGVDTNLSVELSREEEYQAMLKTIRKKRKADVKDNPLRYKGKGAYAKGLPR